MNKICGYNCEHNKGGICQLTYCNKIGKMTTSTTNDNREITIYKGSVDTSTGKIILNDIEITDTESWNKAIYIVDEKDKEIERLNAIIDIKTNRIQQLMKRLSKRQEKVDELNNIIEELEKYLERQQKLYGINQQRFSWGVCGEALEYLKELKEGKQYDLWRINSNK